MPHARCEWKLSHILPCGTTRIHGLGEQPTEVVAVYQVNDGAIANVWFFYP